MFLFPLLILIIIVWAVFYLISPSKSNHTKDNNISGYSLDRSLEILRERYAKGEINEEEYQRIKRNLER